MTTACPAIAYRGSRCWARSLPVLLLVAACSGAGAGGKSQGAHIGPPVDASAHGPQRFLDVALEGFDADRAMDTLRFGDRFYRAPASDGYESVLEHLRSELAAAGFGREAHLELEELTVDPEARAWTPSSASLELVAQDGTREVLHAFDEQADIDRLMLPFGAPACDLLGEAVFDLTELRAGSVLVTEAAARTDILKRAAKGGAVAVLSSSLAGYNLNPETGQPIQDALRFRPYPSGADMPVMQISRATHKRLQATAEQQGTARVHMQAEVTFAPRPLRMLAATVVGRTRPDETVVLPSHIEFAGASDNASGFAGSLECATLLAREIAAGRMQLPARGLTFLYGPIVRQSRTWLAQSKRRAVAAVTFTAAGDGAHFNGSEQLLERDPDPGAIESLPPDQHTQWGTADVDPSSLRPNGLSIVARCAMTDVAQRTGSWRTADHPWEGGCDHDAFIEAGVPAVLYWHFTTSWYHTSLDRADRMDARELERSAIAALTTALAVADARPADLPRYLRSVDLEEGVRVAAAQAAGKEELAAHWREWCDGSRDWLRALCGE